MQQSNIDVCNANDHIREPEDCTFCVLAPPKLLNTEYPYFMFTGCNLALFSLSCMALAYPS